MARLLQYSLLLLLLTSWGASAQSIRSVQHGNWENTGTWHINSLPIDGDSIIIRMEDTVLITNPSLTFNIPMHVVIYGGLEFDDGKLNLAAGSTITIESTGVVFGNGKGNNDKIRIGSDGLWTTKDGPIYGSLVWGQAPLSATSLDFEVKAIDSEYVKLIIEGKISSKIHSVDVEKSLDGVQYETLKSISVEEFEANGNSAELEDFYAVDGNNYYRLTFTDVDNAKVGQVVKMLNFSANQRDFKVFPNPANGHSDIQLTSNLNEDYRVVVLDSRGSIVSDQNLESGSVLNKTIVNRNELLKGVYMVKCIHSEGSITQRLIVK